MPIRREFPFYANVSYLDGEVPHHKDGSTIELTSCFQVFVYLEGSQKFYVDDQLFDIDAGQGSHCHPQVMVMHRRRRGVLRSLPSLGEQRVSKVKVSVPVTWARETGLATTSPELKNFVSCPLNFCVWSAGKDLQDLAREVIEPSVDFNDGRVPQELTRIYRTAKGMELLSLTVADMLGALKRGDTVQHAKPGFHADKVREYILSHLMENLSIDALSRETGASKRSIQRSFKERFDVTVSEFIRKQRLEKARQAIERDGLTVGQAAHMIGYNNISSFTSAFKQTYGATPKTWRTRG